MNKEVSKLVQEITTEKHGTISVGGILYRREDVYKIVKIEETEWGPVCYCIDPDGDEHKVSRSSLQDYYQYYEGDFDDLVKKAIALKRGEFDLSEYQEQSNSESTQLMKIDKKSYEVLLSDVKRRRHELSIIQAHYLSILEREKRNLRSIIDTFNKKINKLREIIWTIELYLGIEEDIVRIQQGAPASDEEPIHLLQARLYMDEEVGDPSDGGLDFKNIEDFDNWMLSKSKFYGFENYKLIVPFPKCVRIMRVRRDQKEYHDNPWVNFEMNIPNMETYIIIRNGENIYTISTTMRFDEKLFPDSDELVKMYEEMDKDINNPNIISRSYDPEERHKNKIDEFMHTYRRNMVVMQGLLDRTEVFGNMSGKVSFMNEKSAEEGKIVFFYENQGNQIEDGSVDPLKWFEIASSNPVEGQRVLVITESDWKTSEERNYRIYNRYFSNKWAYPDAIRNGIYTLHIDKEHREYGENKTVLYVKYLPNDEVYTEYGSKERTRRFRWRLHPKECINFDLISHRNIQWVDNMLHDRRVRKHYSRYMNTLIALKKYKDKELEEELPFCQLIQSYYPKLDIDEIRDYVFWWKTKNKWKRSLTVDDQKAIRMIRKKIESTYKT